MALGLLAAGWAATTPARADLRSTISGGVLTSLGDAVAGSVARSLTIPTSSPPVVYRYDAETGSFERQNVVGANLQLESPESLGRGATSIRLSYQYFDFERFGGQDLDDLRDPHPIVIDKVPAIAIDHADVGLEIHQAVLAVTHGVTEHFDVDLLVPLLAAQASRTDAARLYGANAVEPAAGSITDSAFGVGDVELRGKLQIPFDYPVDLAVELGLRLPTGDEDDLLGTGGVDVRPSVALASRPWTPTEHIAVRAVFNAAFAVATNDLDQSEGQWAAGVGAAIFQSFTAEVAFLGRHAVGPIAPDHAFDLPHCVQGCRPGEPPDRTAALPLFGFSNDRPDYYDASIGFRWAVLDTHLSVFAAGRFPLNDDGVRTGIVPMAGLEATY
jgi:hypothetical protein